MQIIDKKLTDLKPYANNPRHNSKAVPAVKESILKFGFKVPIVIDKNNTIVCGHTRFYASKEIGLEKVPCIVADDLTQEQIDAFRLVDNRTSEFADWNFDKLAEELSELQDFDFEPFGFDDLMAGVTTDFIKENDVKEDDYDAEPPKEAKTKYGDVYQLGNHRLMCGDSTKEEDVEKLMNGEIADLLFTDPPYNVSLEKKSKTVLKSKNYSHIENDDVSLDEFKEFLENVFKNANKFLNEEGSYYVFSCQGGDSEMMMMMMMREAGIRCRHQIIWVKDAPVFSMGRLDYDYKHEPILYGWKKKHNFYRKGNQDKSVWEFKRTENKLHPTMKPVKLIENALLNSTKQGDNVLDLFGGSGSTLIACEQLDRKCYMMELDPIYCDVIIDRWEKFTGKKAEKING